MALKKDQLLAIAKLLKMDEAAFKTAMDAEAEVEIAIPEVNVFTASELESRENTLKGTSQRIGKELAIKELKEKAGLEYDGQGSKDPERFLTEYQKKALKDANITESDKIKEKDQIIEQLRTNLSAVQAEKDGFIRTTKEAQQETEILSWTIDKKPDNLTNKEWVALIKMNNEITEHDGQIVVKRDGQIVANKTDLKPVPAKDAILSFIEERKIGKVEQQQQTAGRGAGDSKTNYSGIVNMKQFKEQLAKEGINANGEVAKARLAEITSANPDFDFKE